MHHLSRDAEASNRTTAAGHLVSQQLLSLTSGYSILRRGPDVAYFTDLGGRLSPDHDASAIQDQSTSAADLSIHAFVDGRQRTLLP
jgi:hypothetical protein